MGEITVNLNRRNFLKASTLASGSLLMGISFAGCTDLPNAVSVRESDSFAPNAWLEITKSNQVIFTLDKAEMGQGVYTGLTTIVAEELDIHPEKITVVFATANRAYNSPGFGMQMTGASASVATSWDRIRQAGASARQILVESAAQIWLVKGEEINTDNGSCYHKGKDLKLSYGELVSQAVLNSKSSEVQLKDPSAYKYIGQFNQRLDAKKKIFAQAEFGIDAELPDMHYAVLSRPVKLGAKAVSYNQAEVEALNGVVSTHLLEKYGVAIVAKSYWAARKAQKQLTVEWQESELSKLDSNKVQRLYQDAIKADDGNIVREEGDLQKALKQGGNKLKKVGGAFEFPFLAHAPMEPQNCTVHINNDQCDIWAPTQLPDVAKLVAIQITGLSHEKVHIHQTFLGGGFGRRLSQDFVEEAVAIAQVAGKPIKHIWSREEDTKGGYYRPATYHEAQVYIQNDQLVGWQHNIVAPRILNWFGPNMAGTRAPEGMPPALLKRMGGSLKDVYENYHSAFKFMMVPEDETPMEGAREIPYQIPNIDVRHIYADAGVPLIFWRSVGNSFNAYVVETLIDDAAAELGKDPMTMRRELLRQDQRQLAIIEEVATLAGWGQTAEGVYQGIACHYCFGSYAAQVVEISQSARGFKIDKVYCVVDCGRVINPEIVVMQMESAIIYGLSAALYGQITYQDGAVQQSNFHDYQVLRMNETPVIEVEIHQSEEVPTGVGEQGLPPVAPALSNALFAATGNRQRKLPLVLS